MRVRVLRSRIPSDSTLQNQHLKSQKKGTIRYLVIALHANIVHCGINRLLILCKRSTGELKQTSVDPEDSVR